MRNKKGFTLIELLVVIAIIGLLSTLAVISLNTARAKARDAKRLSDIKQVSSLIEIAAADFGNYYSIPQFIATPTGTGEWDAVNHLVKDGGTLQGTALQNFADPSSPAETCDTGVTATTCEYAIHQVPNSTTDNYMICFETEETSTYGAKGLYNISNGGVVASGCPTLP